MFYKAHITGNKEGIYIDSRNCETYIQSEKCENYKAVDFDGVNGLVVYRDNEGKMYIVQASGFSDNRGLFVDMYDHEGNKVNIPDMSSHPVKHPIDNRFNTDDCESLINYDIE